MYQLNRPISALVVYWVRPQHALIGSEAKQILPVADVLIFLPTLPGIFTPTHPAFTTMSIATLIQAAEWLERRERGVNSLGNWINLPQFLCWNFQRLKKHESHAFSTWRPCLSCGLQSCHFKAIFSWFSESEHGYASSMPMPEDYSRRRVKSSTKRQQMVHHQGSPIGNRQVAIFVLYF